MKRRDFVLSTLSSPLLLSGWHAHAQTATPAAARSALKQAAAYMDEVVSFRGGYVWSYAPDLSQQFGEMEAYRTMCWLQPSGTPSVGHAYLDAYHATGDERFYKAAFRTAMAVKQAQRGEGGWNYIHDFTGEGNLKRWYETIGRNGWRLEEFQHYYGNSTFDDATTAVASQLMLRMFLEKKDPRFLIATLKAVDFIQDAQFGRDLGIADGGWPQRFPHARDSIESMPMPNAFQLPPDSWAGMEDGDYTLHVTFNDDVMGENIKFLTMCVMSLGMTWLTRDIRRAMDCMKRMQQPAPQAGWGLQHLSRPRNGRPAGAPAGARTYEPRSLTTHTTQTNCQQLMNYFTLTGDRSYLARIPEAIAWLKTCPLPPNAVELNPQLGGGRTHPTFVQLGTNDAIYVHRYGSNIHNGAYFFNKNIRDTLSHYSAGRAVNIPALEARHAQLAAMTDAEVEDMVERSPLSARRPRKLPKYFTAAGREVDFADLFEGAVMTTPVVPETEVATLISELGTKGYWTAPVPEVLNPFIGDGPSTPHLGTEYQSKHVGDIYDTSPYPSDNPPAIAPYVPRPKPQFIVTADWIRRMGRLISYVSPVT
jgi:hypothetical protein